MANHDAAEIALGYLYQVRWAFLAFVREARTRPDLAMSLEVLDDVSFEDAGGATELLQVKHHIGRTGQLGDMSVDVWKTIKVWIDSPLSRRPDGPMLSLISTGVAADDSAMAQLRSTSRDPMEAVRKLDLAARASTNQTTATARISWLGLTAHDRLGLTRRMFVSDRQETIEEVDRLVKDELSLAAPFGHEDAYVERVLEWWSRVAIDLLRKQRSAITALDLRARLSDIRDYFRADNLPTTVYLADVDEYELATEYGDENFVRQLQWINLNAVHLRKAVVDYHRAFTQTTKWLDNSLIGVAEIQDFEDNLVDEWERSFADMQQDLSIEHDDAAKRRAGLDLFRALSASTTVTIRALYDEPFFARGKRHELANVGQVGWHPDFKQMLSALIGPA